MSDTMKDGTPIAERCQHRLRIANMLGGQILPYEYRRLAEELSRAEAERDALKADNTTFLKALTEEDAAVIHRVTSAIIAARAKEQP